MVELARQAGVIRLYALCHVDHQASRRVLEKGGFTAEGLLLRHTVFPNLAEAPCDTWSYVRILPSGSGSRRPGHRTVKRSSASTAPCGERSSTRHSPDCASGTVWRL